MDTNKELQPLENMVMENTRKWNGVYFRANLSDQGNVPRSGSLCHCPDIIPYGIMPVDNPDEFFLVKNWDKDLGKDFIARMQNYIYLRVKNLNEKKTLVGELHLYWCKASLLMYPDIWKKNIIKLGNGTDHFKFKIKPGGKVVSYDNKQGTFNWAPEMIQNDHYCLVGRIVTSDNPNPIPDVGTINNFGKFIANNPGYGWHNVVVIDRGSPSYSISVNYNQGGVGGKMHVILTCTNVPLGAEVGFSCPTPGPNPLVNLKRSKVNNPKTEVFGIVSDIPANWDGTITYHYWANGTNPPVGFNIELAVVYFVHSDDDLYEHCIDAKYLVPDHMLRDIGPQKGIILGAHTMKGV
ncbi:MAG: hypothetical protein ACEPOV_05220 [Hyphomicrobiales bacterium]